MPQVRPHEVATLAAITYRDAIKEFRLHPYTDMSRSEKCHTLTKDLMVHLQSAGFPVRREFHSDARGFWHFIIAHCDAAAKPTEHDLITDLTPWAFQGGELYTGHLHGPRKEVMQNIREAGANEKFIALRGLSTLTLPHTDLLLPSTARPAPPRR